MIQEMNTQQLDSVRAEQRVRLIDVRTTDEHERSSIPDSEHVPLHLIPLKMPEYGAQETIVFYCATGARSSQACYYFQSHGHDNVFNLRGGIRAWAHSGLALASMDRFHF